MAFEMPQSVTNVNLDVEVGQVLVTITFLANAQELEEVLEAMQRWKPQITTEVNSV